jgi:urate oxidase
MVRIVTSSHGEARLRMLRIVRRGDRHDPRDLTLSLRFEGQFADAFTSRRPDGVIPSEALKRFVYAAAREHGTAEIESLGIALGAHLLAAHPRITLVRTEIAEQPWTRMEAGGKAQGQAFVGAGPELRTAIITSDRRGVAAVAGIDRLLVMRSSGFLPRHAGAVGVSEDVHEGLAPLVVGDLSVRWSYTSADVTFGPYRQGVRNAILDTFALQARHSVQHTLHAIAEVILASYQEIDQVTLAMHERPYRPADLFRDNVENPDELFVAIEEPLAIVEVTVGRE